MSTRKKVRVLDDGERLVEWREPLRPTWSGMLPNEKPFFDDDE